MITSNPILFMVLVALCSVLSFAIIETVVNRFKEVDKKDKVDISEDKKNEEEAPVKLNTPTVAYKELLEILDNTIDKEIYFAVKLKFDFQDVKIIDFNSNLKSISTHVMEALSQSYLDDLAYYHNRKWIMEYIVRRVRIYLTEYIRKHPIL